MSSNLPHALGAPLTVATCTRCGAFIEPASDVKLVFDLPYCASCAVRPDVDSLEAFRLKYWGKRDVFTWLIGLTLPFSLVSLVMTVIHEQWWQVPGNMVSVVCLAAFFFQERWARVAVYGSIALSTLMSLQASPELAGLRLSFAFLAVLIWAGFTQTTRNQLFFEMHVPRKQLEKTWNATANNSMARSGFLLGLLSLLIWPLGVVSLVLSIAGLNAVDPRATPPIGRKGQAIAGIVCSSLSTLVLSLALLGRSR